MSSAVGEGRGHAREMVEEGTWGGFGMQVEEMEEGTWGGFGMQVEGKQATRPCENWA